MTTNNPVIQNDLGMVFLVKETTRRQSNTTGRLWQSRPHTREAMQTSGMSLMRSGQFDMAGKELESAVRLNPRIAIAQADLGLLLASRGDYGGAAQHLLEALRVAPANAINESNLCGVLARANRAQP